LVYIKVADEVWIATALLQYESSRDADFRSSEIVDRVAQENIYGRMRPGIVVHVNQHCVASKRPNPGNYRMLAETRRGYRRLHSNWDPVHPYRSGKQVPLKTDIPEKYHYLVDWYNTRFNVIEK
jgi:hypothetical protein